MDYFGTRKLVYETDIVCSKEEAQICVARRKRYYPCGSAKHGDKVIIYGRLLTRRYRSIEVLNSGWEACSPKYTELEDPDNNI